MKDGNHAQRQPVDALANGCGAAHANLLALWLRLLLREVKRLRALGNRCD
jgi:hypothetical protein